MFHSKKIKQKSINYFAVKIDLEKAYYRERWEFINASIKAASILNFLNNVIMFAIKISTMQILWDGTPTQKFRLAKGYAKDVYFHCTFSFCTWNGRSQYPFKYQIGVLETY